MKAKLVLAVSVVFAGLALAGPGAALVNSSDHDFVSDAAGTAFAVSAPQPDVSRQATAGTDVINWVVRTAAPAPGRYWSPGTGVVRDTIYFCGGRLSAAPSVRTITAYDVTNGVWITSGLPNLLTPRRAGGGGRIGNKIYVACGRDSASVTLNTCQEFDVDTKIVTAKANAPAASWACCGAVAAGKLYIMGSETNGTGNYEYDPVANTWATKAALPVGRGWTAAAGAGGKVYLCGGSSAGGVLNDCRRYDPATNTWTAMANMPGPRAYHIAVSFQDTLVYVLGGNAVGGSAVPADNIVYRYHIPSNTWTIETPMITPRGWMMANEVGNSIWVAYGSNCTTPTYLTNNEEGQLAAPNANDIGVDAVLAPPASMNPGTVAPKARIRNFGTAAQSGFPVLCWIDSGATRVYNQSVTYSGSLGSGAVDSVTFPNWTSGPSGAQYRVTMFTNLATEQNRANDTSYRNVQISGAVFSETIIVRRLAVDAPTIDGRINPGEWNPSIVYDISDIAGRSGTPRPAGSVLAYFLYDSAAAAVYIAGDIPPVTTRGNYDQLGPYMDENHSHTWSTDSSEGNHWIEFVSNDSVVYRALLSTAPAVWRMPGQCPGAVSASGVTSGHLQFEAKIRIGTLKGDFNVRAGDTVGFFMYMAQAPGNIYWGWWPQSLMMSNWANPTYYGHMIFDRNITGVEEPIRVPGFALEKVAPTVVRDFVRVSYFVGSRTSASLCVYDEAGKLVRTLASGAADPGQKTVTWDRRSGDGSRVAAGTYFFRLTVEGRSVTHKSVLLD